MEKICPDLCPQCKRALRLLIDTNKPHVDRPAVIAAVPEEMTHTAGGLLDLIIQIILALLEGKDKPNDEPPMPPPTK